MIIFFLVLSILTVMVLKSIALVMQSRYSLEKNMCQWMSQSKGRCWNSAVVEFLISTGRMDMIVMMVPRYAAQGIIRVSLPWMKVDRARRWKL